MSVKDLYQTDANGIKIYGFKNGNDVIEFGFGINSAGEYCITQHDPLTGEYESSPFAIQRTGPSTSAVKTNAAGLSNVVVYREGGTDSGNVYSSFAKALSAARAAYPASIFIDQSLGAPNVPTGIYNIENIRLVGGDGEIPSIAIADGAMFVGGCLYVNNVTLNPEGTFVSLSNDDVMYVTLENSAGIQGGASAAILVDDESSLFLSIKSFGFFYTNQASIVNVTTDAACYIFTDIAAGIYAHTLSGDGAITVDDLLGKDDTDRNFGISHTQSATNISYIYG